MLRLALVLALVTAGCGDRAITSPNDSLTGRYELKSNLGRGASTKPFLVSLLKLRKDGTFEQTCSGNGVDKLSEGRWGTNENSVWLTNFLDCAQAWPDSRGPSRVELPFSGGSEPVIVVEPDLNVIYVRVSDQLSQ